MGEVGLGKELLISRRSGVGLYGDWEGGTGSGMRQPKVVDNEGMRNPGAFHVPEGILGNPTFWKWFWGTLQFLGGS